MSYANLFELLNIYHPSFWIEEKRMYDFIIYVPSMKPLIISYRLLRQRNDVLHDVILLFIALSATS